MVTALTIKCDWRGCNATIVASTQFNAVSDHGWKEESYVLTPKTGRDLFFDGRQYAVPYNSVLTCYYYNVDMFEKSLTTLTHS